MRLLFVAILVASVACGGPGSVAPTSATASAHPQLLAWTYEGVLREHSIDNRTVTLTGGGYRQVFSRAEAGGIGTATSSDGLHWSDEGDSAIGYYIPVRMEDGTYRAFGANLYKSTDARHWTVIGRIVPPPEPTAAQCFATSGIFSDVFALQDGTFRAYFNCIVGSYFNISATAIRSATSSDGLLWQVEPGERINPLDGPEMPRGSDGKVNGAGAAEHPQVIRLPDGMLKMFYWSKTGRIWSATSVDGLTWANRRPENLEGSDPDALVLADGRVRLYVNGNVGLTADFAGASAGQSVSRTASFVYGPTNYRLEIPGKLTIVPSAVPKPSHLSVKVEGSGPALRLGAYAYGGTGGPSPAVFDVVNGPSQPVTVVFKPPSGKPPFSADAAFNWTVDSLQQGSVISGGIVIVADDGTTRQVLPVDYANGAAGPACGAGTTTPCPNTACGPGTGIACGNPGCGPGTGTPCPANSCGPGTGTPCPPSNCGPSRGTPCVTGPTGDCAAGANCPGPPTNCGPGQPIASCPSPEVQCVKGQPIPSQGCVTGGYDGLPKLCLPKGIDPIAPPICQEFY